MAVRIIRLRYAGTCASCEAALPSGTRAAWDANDKTITCVNCVDVPAAEVAERGAKPVAAVDLFDLAPEALGGETREALEVPGQDDLSSAEPPIDRGKAGASAAREWRKRHERLERQIRDRYGRFGGLVLAFSGGIERRLAEALPPA
jgi:hypothetical protein